jgi:hypothetical protein
VPHNRSALGDLLRALLTQQRYNPVVTHTSAGAPSILFSTGAPGHRRRFDVSAWSVTPPNQCRLRMCERTLTSAPNS